VCIRELDPDTNQVIQVTSDKKYLWDSLQIAEERTTDGGTVLRRFYGQGFVDTDGTVLYYTRDHLGSIRELTDGSQGIRARYDYDPYGRMTKLQGDRDSAFTYTGHFWHAQSGLNLAPYRAFDPNLGRWISRDPIHEKGGINLYGYALNSPISLVDPSGFDAGQACLGPESSGYPVYGPFANPNANPEGRPMVGPFNTPDFGPIYFPAVRPTVPWNSPDPTLYPSIYPTPPFYPFAPNPDNDAGTLPRNLPATTDLGHNIQSWNSKSGTVDTIYGYTEYSPQRIVPIGIRGPVYGPPGRGPGVE
jgi:RHS repeat-associated protein